MEEANRKVLREAKSCKAARLRRMMEAREEAFNRLVELDCEIWVLEEYFRNRSS